MRARLELHGSVDLVRPLDPEATAWLREHTDGTWYCGALVVEPRYVPDLVAGFNGDGGEVVLHA